MKRAKLVLILGPFSRTITVKRLVIWNLLKLMIIYLYVFHDEENCVAGEDGNL